MEFDYARGIVFIENILLVLLYVTIGIQAWKRRTRTQWIYLRSMYLGVIWLAIGIVSQAVVSILFILYFWGEVAGPRVLIWQIGLAGFFIGAFYTLRYDFRSFEEFYQDEAVHDYQRATRREGE